MGRPIIVELWILFGSVLLKLSWTSILAADVLQGFGGMIGLTKLLSINGCAGTVSCLNRLRVLSKDTVMGRSHLLLKMNPWASFTLYQA